MTEWMRLWIRLGFMMIIRRRNVIRCKARRNGMECDHYSILAEIIDFRLETNYLSSEKVYSFILNCNGLPLTVCINEKDLLGEPQIGRRFRGNIWLQGEIRL